MSRVAHQDLTLALAGVLQSASLVHQLARRNNYDGEALHQSSFSLLQVTVDSTDEIFGSSRSLRVGLECITRLLSGRGDSSSAEVLRYAVGMHQLSVKLRHSGTGQTVIEEGLKELRGRYLKHYRSLEHDDPLHDDLAALYARSISCMRPRIMVRGEQGKLENPLTSNRVRSALFAGIRAAWLWHQLGGRRWQLIFHRHAYRSQAQRLLARM